MNRRTYGGSGRHALPAVKHPDGSDIVQRVKGSPDDVRKVLWRNGVAVAWMDTLDIDPAYVGAHRMSGEVWTRVYHGTDPDTSATWQVNV